MNLYPAIDIKSGRCVRLVQGLAERQSCYFEDPVQPARLWKEAGAEWVHVVDLDGAFEGRPVNLEVVRRIVAEGMRVQLGGGMRDVATVQAALEAGVERVIVGTRACEEPAFVGELVKRFGTKAIAVGIDAKDGKVAVKGWVETSQTGAHELAKVLEGLGVRTLIYTDISRDGMLSGPNFEAQEAMLKATRMRVIASGGVASNADIEALRELAERYDNLDGVIIGKALYEGRVNLAQALSGISMPK